MIRLHSCMSGSDPGAPATQGILKTPEGWFSGWSLLPLPIGKEGETKEGETKEGETSEPTSDKRVSYSCLVSCKESKHGAAGAVCLLKGRWLEPSWRDCNPLILASFHRSRRARTPHHLRMLGRGVRLCRLGSLWRGRAPIRSRARSLMDFQKLFRTW